MTFFLIILYFFGIFLGMFQPGLSKNGTMNEIFFLSFSTYPDSVWLEMKSEWSFFNCSNLFTIFLGMLQPESGRNGTKNNFFFSFSACPSPVWLKKNCLNFFTICFEFFLECSNLGWALIYFFFSLFWPVLTWFGKKWSQNDIFEFFLLNFLKFLGKLQPRLGRNNTLNNFFFFFTFLACPDLVWLEMMPEWCFFGFLNFFTSFFEFFWECSSPSRAKTLLGMNFFLILFRSFPAHFG